MQDIGDLEGYVRATGVMLFFLSKHYFTSRNCLREVNASLDAQRPLVLVHEQQEEKGGGPLETLRAECRKEMHSYIFDGHTPITWHRIAHYQNLTLKLIATEMLRHGPKYRDALHDSLAVHGSRDSTSDNRGPSAQQELSLVLPGEVNVGELALPQPLVLWCSAANPGAAGIAQELEDALAAGGAVIRVVDRKPQVPVLNANGENAAMLLYLNKDTWIQQGEVLERDVRAARKLRTALKVVLVHENDKEKGGCEFGDFFGTTPHELIDDGIYRLACRLNHIARCPTEHVRSN